MSKSSRKTNYKIPTRREIMKKYGLSEKQFENLRRRTGERIKNAQLLYNIPDSGIPRVNQLIDYALKEKRQKIYTFENILQTPATHRGKISHTAKRIAARNITGRSATPHNACNTLAHIFYCDTDSVQSDILYSDTDPFFKQLCREDNIIPCGEYNFVEDD